MVPTLLSLPIGQAAQVKQWWVTTWLTPIWFLAVGVAFGLLILAGFTLLFRLLSATPVEKFSRGPIGHIVAAILTAIITVGIIYNLPEDFFGKSELQEPLLMTIALSLCCAILGWSLVFCSGKQASKDAIRTLTDGVSGYMLTAACIVVVIGGVIWGVSSASNRKIIEEPFEAFRSIPKLFTTGVAEVVLKVPAATGDEAEFVKQDLNIDFELLSQLEISSDVDVLLADAGASTQLNRVPVDLLAGESVFWRNSQRMEDLPIPYEDGTTLYIQNKEIYDANVTVKTVTRPPVPQATSFLITAIAVALIGLSILLQQAVAPRVSAVSHATLKNELAQPLFLVLMLLGTFVILLFVFLPFNTFGEDIKLLKDCGITSIMLLAAFQGIWSASSSISEEIEGKTALTVLSKPIHRRSFIIGKFMGIFWVICLMFVVLGLIEMFAVAYKPLYEAREASQDDPVWQLCHLEMFSTVPGLAMALMQAVVLTAISVALATRLPQLANLAVCFAIYIVGNLTTSLVSSTQEGFEIVKFVAQLVATIIPILEHFSMQAAIDSGNSITFSLLSGSLIYCLLYVLLSMFLALLMFEDRDLA